MKFEFFKRVKLKHFTIGFNVVFLLSCANILHIYQSQQIKANSKTTNSSFLSAKDSVADFPGFEDENMFEGLDFGTGNENEKKKEIGIVSRKNEMESKNNSNNKNNKPLSSIVPMKKDKKSTALNNPASGASPDDDDDEELSNHPKNKKQDPGHNNAKPKKDDHSKSNKILNISEKSNNIPQPVKPISEKTVKKFDNTKNDVLSTKSIEKTSKVQKTQFDDEDIEIYVSSPTEYDKISGSKGNMSTSKFPPISGKSEEIRSNIANPPKNPNPTNNRDKNQFISTINKSDKEMKRDNHYLVNQTTQKVNIIEKENERVINKNEKRKNTTPSSKIEDISNRPALNKPLNPERSDHLQYMPQANPQSIENLIPYSPKENQNANNNFQSISPSRTDEEESNSENIPNYTMNSRGMPSSISKQNSFEKINKSKLRQFYKPEILDMTRITTLDNLISNLRNDFQKKSMENSQLQDTYKQLDMNYEQMNNQGLVYQAQIDSLASSITLLEKIRASYMAQIDKLKEGSGDLNELNDSLKKMRVDMESKSESIQKYQQKIQTDIQNISKDQKTFEEKVTGQAKALEEVKNSHHLELQKKIKMMEAIKNSFKELEKEEIKFLAFKNQEHDLELQLKHEENSEKILALEIEHLKSMNLVEVQKIEELKQEIEKSKTYTGYLKQEIDELEEKLKTDDNETKQNQLEYELKKNELEEKLSRLKEEMTNEQELNKEEKERYSQIENEIKNKISSLSLQNYGQSFISTTEDDKKNTQKLAEKYYNFKQAESSQIPEEEKLKRQILSLLKKLNTNI